MAMAWKYLYPEINSFAATWLERLADDLGNRRARLFLGQDCEKLGFVCDNGAAMNTLYPGIMSDNDVLNAVIDKIHYVSLLGNAVYSQWRHCAVPGNEAYFNRRWFVAVLERMRRLTAEEIVPPNIAIADMIDDARGDPAENDLRKFLPNKSSLPEIRKLLKRGFDVNSRDDLGRTPLMYCAYSSPDYVRELIDNGADCNAVDNAGNSVLMYHCDSFDMSTFDLVLERGADINVKNKQGYTVLDFAVLQGLPISRLVERDAKITRIIPERLPEVVAEDALHNDRIFDKLLKSKAILSADFIYALLFGHAEKWCEFMVRLFRAKPPKFDWEALKFKLENPVVTDTVLRGCAMYLPGKYFEFLLSLTGIAHLEIHDDTYCDLLKLAIGEKDALLLLLKRFGNPDGGVVRKDNEWVYGFSGKKATSPLMFAVRRNDFESAKTLLAYGADVNIRDADGSALAYAVRENRMRIFKLLLTYKADPNSAPSPDLMPLALARKYNRQEMVALLKQHGAVDDDGDDKDEETNPVNTVVVPEFKIAGTFAVATRNELASSISAGDRLRLFREPKNEYDKNAIRIEDENSHKLGYVPKDIARKLAPEMDSGVSLWGKVIDIARKKIEITAMIYRRQVIPLDGMTGFTLIESTGSQPFPAVTYRYSLSVRERKLECEVTRGRIDIRHIEVVFDKDEWPNILKDIRRCNFLAWQDNYDILYGGHWDLTVRMRGGRKFHVSGTALYPEEWGIMLNFFYDSLNPFRVKGSGSFSVKNIAGDARVPPAGQGRK